MNARVIQISVSPRGGVPKLPIESARVEANGLVGDKQRHTKIHGGPERAVCLYAQELLDALAAEGHAVFPGAMGENVTLAGVDWAVMLPGTRVKIGNEVELEVTTYAHPCCAIEEYFIDWKPQRVGQKTNPGWSRVYTRVLSFGTINTGDVVTVTPVVTLFDAPSGPLNR